MNKSGEYRMILGASLFDDPAVLLYGSPDGKDGIIWGRFTWLQPIFERTRHAVSNARISFSLMGAGFLSWGFSRLCRTETGRRHLLYALIGEFDGHHFRPTGSNLQLLDFGADFYAMQNFEADGRRIAHAWLFNSGNAKARPLSI